MDNNYPILQRVTDGRLSIIVKPSSPRNEVLGWDEARDALKVAIAAPPENNKANIEVIKFFSRLLKKKVTILRGLTARKKVLGITDGKSL